MKTKSLNRKLFLNKQTITSLNNSAMDRLKGGKEWTDGCTPSCGSVHTLCDCPTGITECTCPCTIDDF